MGKKNKQQQHGAAPGTSPPQRKNSFHSLLNRASTPIPIIDVLIVGGGPVGLSMACECARYGLSVRLIEKNLTRSPYSKAFGIHAR